MAKPLRVYLRELGQRQAGIPAAAAAPVPLGPGPRRPGRRTVGRVLGLGALMSAAGGLPPQRPDQEIDASSAGIAPGTTAGILRARLVIVSGPHGGVFVYNGTPGPGTLIASVTGAGGTDPGGFNTVLAGVVGYAPAGGGAFNAIQIFGGNVSFLAAPSSSGTYHQTATMQSSITAAVTNVAALIAASTGEGTLTLQASTALGTDVQAQLALASATLGNIPLLTTNAAVVLDESAGPAAQGAGPALFGDNFTGAARYVADSTHGDSNKYDTGERTYFNSAAVPIPASGFQAIMASHNVESGLTYKFWGKFRLKQGAAGSIPGNIGFSMPAVSFGTWDAFWNLQGALNTFNSSNTTNLPGQINVLGAQTVANDEAIAWYSGIAIFSASGAMTAGCQADGVHPFTAQPGCIFTIRPVGF